MAVALPIEVTAGITHTVFVDDLGNLLNASCAEYVNAPGASLLKLRQMAPISQIISLAGRTPINRLDLTQVTLFDYEMRRKAETLQHKKNQSGFSKKKQYADISKTKSGSYFFSSSRDLNQRIINNLDCPSLDKIIRPPTNSGIRDYKYPGYYYDVDVPYYPKL
jgi:hypothetical protein